MKQIQIITLCCLVIGIFFTEHINAGAVHWLSQPEGDLGLVLNKEVDEMKVSANGRFVAFSSSASNIVAGDNNQSTDYFFHDTVKNRTVRIAEQVVKHQDGGYISGFSAPTSDGKWISFIGKGDFGFAQESSQLYRQNMNTGEIHQIGLDSDGVAYLLDNRLLFLADDGSSVFFSTKTKLSPLHTNSYSNVYQKDLNNGSVTLLSVALDESSAANNDVYYFAVSGNLQYVVMRTRASNLAVNSVAGYGVYLRDNSTKTTRLVTVKPNGDPSGYNDYNSTMKMSVSNSGYVAFVSGHDDLVANDTNSKSDLFLFNGTSNTRINVDSTGQEVSAQFLSDPFISADNTRLIFSDISALLAEDTNSSQDIYSYQLNDASLSLVTRSNDGNGSVATYSQGISENGQQVFLISGLNQSNGSHYDYKEIMFKYNFDSEQMLDINPAIFNPNTVTGSVVKPAISNDQQWAVYSSTARNLTASVKPDNNEDLFLLDRSTDSHQIIGRRVSSPADISASGRFVTYTSQYSQPAGVGDLGDTYVFLYDRVYNQYKQVADGSFPKVNNAGKVVFSTKSSLLPNDTNNNNDIYLFDPDGSGLSLISVNIHGEAGSSHSYRPDINDLDDQVWVVFMSDSNDLIVADHNSKNDIFMRQWPNGQTFRVSQTALKADANGSSSDPSLSEDGAYVAFTSAATNLSSDNYNGAGHTQGFVYDRINQGIELVTKYENNLPIGGSYGVLGLDISNSGKYVVYTTRDKVLPEDNDNQIDAYLHERHNQLNRLISKTSTNQQVAEPFFSARVVEDTAVSPPKVGVVFSGTGSLTGVAEHPGYSETYLYQQDDLDEVIFENGFE